MDSNSTAAVNENCSGLNDEWTEFAIAHPGFGRIDHGSGGSGGSGNIPHTCPPSFRQLPMPLKCVDVALDQNSKKTELKEEC